MDFSGVSEMVQTAVAAARRSGREAIPGIQCADVARIARSQMRGCLETPSQETPSQAPARAGKKLYRMERGSGDLNPS